MLNPEVTDGLIAMGKSEAAGGMGVAETGWIEIKTKVMFLCPFNPA
jgi:hypothetical protein